ncbi:MAG: DUF6868 family protein [Planctomycetota bacterium]
MAMDIATVRAFFLWCTILNGALLLFSSVVGVFAGDFAYRMNNRFFSVSREAFSAIMCSFIGLFKIFFFVFNLVPYIALVIIS